MTTYTQLVSDVAAWTVRTDLADKIPGFTKLFESRVNRLLRVRKMEASFTGTIASNTINLPSDFLEFKRLWVDGYEHRQLHPQTLEVVMMETEGVPTLYALDGSKVRFNGTGSITGVYYQSIPSLQTNEYNWLSVAGYECYLFGVLAEAENYLKNDIEMQKHWERSKAAMDQLMGADNRLHGPLVARKA